MLRANGNALWKGEHIESFYEEGIRELKDFTVLFGQELPNSKELPKYSADEDYLVIRDSQCFFTGLVPDILGLVGIYFS